MEKACNVRKHDVNIMTAYGITKLAFLTEKSITVMKNFDVPILSTRPIYSMLIFMPRGYAVKHSIHLQIEIGKLENKNELFCVLNNCRNFIQILQVLW